MIDTESHPFIKEIHMADLAEGPITMDVPHEGNEPIDRLTLLSTNITGPARDDWQLPVFVEFTLRISKDVFPQFILRKDDPAWEDAITEAFLLYDLIEADGNMTDLETLRELWKSHKKDSTHYSESIVDHAYITDEGFHIVRYRLFHPKAILDMETDWYEIAGGFNALDNPYMQDHFKDLVDTIYYSQV